MWGVGGLVFGAPLALLGLLALPVLWRLLRVTPPAPRRYSFFGLRFLQGISTDEQTPAKTPLWLLILRMAAAALIVVALAEPIVNATRLMAGGERTLVIVVDDGWAAAHAWDARREAMREAIEEASRSDAAVLLVPTATRDAEIKIDDPQSALSRAMGLEPQPLPPDRAAALPRIEAALAGRTARVLWLADGVAAGEDEDFARGLARLGALEVVTDAPGGGAYALLPPAGIDGGIALRILRPGGGPEANGFVRAFGAQGRFIGQAPYALAAGSAEGEARMELPVEFRNEIERIEIAERESAGAVTLLDESSRRRPVGVVLGDAGGVDQPLLSPGYYLERALAAVGEARPGMLREHLQRGVAVLMLADVGQIAGDDYAATQAWVEGGGVLVRFAGPRLAAQADDLLPVALRSGGAREIGGALSWEKPQALAAFSTSSPFAGLKVPEDVVVTRQVLAEPSLDLEQKTWAELADGTPLVTAARRGQGWIVLFHVGANADWSNLPLSGVFVDMLGRLMTLSKGVDAAEGAAAVSAETLRPRLVLDGYGRLQTPPARVEPIARTGASAGPDTPPGLYGEGGATVALNLFGVDAALAPLPTPPDGASVRAYGPGSQIDLKPWALGIVLLLVAADAIASLWLRGHRFGLRLGPAAAAIVLAVLAFPPREAQAQEPPPTSDDGFAMEATLQTRLAYVVTGDPSVDEMSRLGLEGLTRVLNERTAVAAAEPMAVDVAADELAFFPLIYWPIPDGGMELSDEAVARVDRFMKNGGTILFDSRDGDGQGASSDSLQAILRRLDLPPLQRVPSDHVLTKSFYLLTIFPGRHRDGDVWVQAAGAGPTSEALGDGVSSVIIGAADWASAWAMDEYGRPLASTGLGGERQRELALRFGVNLTMYALTGNYKADQVHIPALLERLGQ